MIAISYRREDSLPITGRLYDRLQARFGKRAVFMDFDSIPPGMDFREQIKRTIGAADVVIAVIGPNWLGQKTDGSRRIDHAMDFVRLEIEYALKGDIPIIPLLVNNAPMPQPETLPQEIEALAYRNALPLDSGLDFNNHAERLITGVYKLIGRRKKETRTLDHFGTSLKCCRSGRRS
ncbi:MAG: toll/interleukin-1 receptor domain-containing protein [Chthoniobacterales bacterium]